MGFTPTVRPMSRKDVQEFLKSASTRDILRLPMATLNQAIEEGLLSAHQMAELQEWERSLKGGPVMRNNTRTIVVDEEVASIINRYATLNGCTPAEAIKRLVMNDAEDHEVERCKHGTPVTVFCKPCDDALPF